MAVKILFITLKPAFGGHPGLGTLTSVRLYSATVLNRLFKICWAIIVIITNSIVAQCETV